MTSSFACRLRLLSVTSSHVTVYDCSLQSCKISSLLHRCVARISCTTSDVTCDRCSSVVTSLHDPSNDKVAVACSTFVTFPRKILYSIRSYSILKSKHGCSGLVAQLGILTQTSNELEIGGKWRHPPSRPTSVVRSEFFATNESIVALRTTSVHEVRVCTLQSPVRNWRRALTEEL